MRTPLSPDSGEWSAQLTLDEEQKHAECGPRVGGPQQVPVGIKGELAARLWTFYEGEGKKVEVPGGCSFAVGSMQGSHVHENWELGCVQRGCVHQERSQCLYRWSFHLL